MTQHLPLFSIPQFQDVFARETWDGVERRTIVFGSKVKLHGANAGVRIATDGTVTPQGRHNDLVAGDKGTDPYRFAEFVNADADTWAAARTDMDLVFYGEWAGAGIAKGDAIQQVPVKRFYIIGVGIGEAPAFWTRNESADKQRTACALYINDPEVIEQMLPEGLDRDRVRVMPYEDTYTFDFSDEEQVAGELARLNAAVDAVGECDPYVCRNFGVQKGGEGLVLTPLGAAPLGQEPTGRTSFKAKVERHRVQKQPAPAVAREPLADNVVAFIDRYCTEPRMEQAIREICGDTPDIRKMREVMAWLVADIFKEGGRDRAALDAEDATIIAAIQAHARPALVAGLKA